MLLIGTGLVILIYGLYDFKKAFLLFMLYQIFWYSGAQLIHVRGLPTITQGLMMWIGFTILFLLNKKKYTACKEPFPYAGPLILVAVSSILTCFVAVAGFGKEITRAVNLILQNVVVVWIAWNVIETKEDFKFLFRGFTVIFFAAALYGLWEYMTRDNGLVAHKLTLTADAFNLYDMNGARGYRVMSFFEHPIGAGMTMGLYVVFLFTALIRYRERLPFQRLAILTAFLCLPCLVLTKMRASLFFTVIASLGFVDFRKRRFYKVMILGVLVGACAVPFLSDYRDLFFSLFSKAAQSNVGGSTSSQRFGQLRAVFELMKLSPVGGLGEKFGDYIENEYTAAALGYESLWFEQMARHGIVGVLSYLVLIYDSVVIIPARYRSKPLLFISLSFWLTYSLTSIPSFRWMIYYLVLFYYIKKSDVYQSRVQRGRRRRAVRWKRIEMR